MNKSESKEVAKILQYHAAGLELDWVARALSALIRSAKTAKSQHEIYAVAVKLKADTNPEFIV